MATGLRFLDPSSLNSLQGAYIFVPDEEAAEVNRQWKNALVGSCIGPNPRYFAVKNSLTRAWHFSQPYAIHKMKHGFFLFDFHSSEDSQQVLDGGPWFIFGQPLILKKWTHDMSLQKEELDRISLWVRFPNLNLSCRTPNALSSISSFIGQPICMDKHTAEGSGLDSARVLIDVSVDSPLLDSVKIHCLGEVFLAGSGVRLEADCLP